MKKMFCFFLSLLLVVSSSLILSRNNVKANMVEDNNVVLNGSFENGTTNWIINDSNQTAVLTNNIQYPAFDGASCIRLPGYRSNIGNSYIYQRIILEKNTDYILTFYAKGISSAVMRLADKRGFDYGDENEISSSNILVDESFGNINDWTQIKVPFDSGEFDDVYLEFEPSGCPDPWNTCTQVANRMCIDGVVIEKSDKTEIINNGSFNNDDSNWVFKNKNDIRIVNEDSCSYLRLAGYRSNQADAYVYQQITVERNTDYELIFYAKGTDNAKVRIANMLGFDYSTENETANATILLDRDFSRLDEWTAFRTFFNSGDNENLYIEFDANNGIDPWNTHSAENRRMCIDDVKIKKCKENEIIKNGSFNNGDSNWNFKNKNDIGIINDDSNSYLRLAGYRSNLADAYVYQQITVERNADYELIFYAKGTDNAKVRIADMLGFDYSTENETTNAAILLDRDFSHLDGWTEVRTFFNSGDNENLYIEFDTNNGIDPWNTHSAENNRMCIDDISIKKSVFLLNGDFENALESWETTNESIDISDEACNGQYALKLSKNYYSRIGQEVFIADNLTTYRLAFKYKGNLNNNIRAWSLSTELFSFDNKNVLYKGCLNSSIEWNEFEIIFSSNGAEKIYLNFQTSISGDWFIDDVVIEPSISIPQEFSESKDPYFVKNTNGHSYYANSNGPYITSDNKNLLIDNSFENTGNSSGAWNSSSFLVEGISVSSNSEAVFTGNYGLEFNSGAKSVKGIFFVPVKPQTNYYYTTFVKMPNWTPTNTGNITFGVINPDTGKFLCYANNNSNSSYSDISQLSPSSPDNQWHTACLQFNSGDANTIGIMISGSHSIVYFDDMYVFEEKDKLLYTDEKSNNRTNWKNAELVSNAIITHCDEDVNIVQNGDFESQTDDFWANSIEDNLNVTIENTNTSEHGNALLYYNEDVYPDRTYYIKWIDIKPNTYYTFSADYMIDTAGKDTFFGLLSGSRSNIRYPAKIATFALNESNYNSGNWQSTSVIFYSNDCNRVGITVFNGGGKAYIDSLRLFETYDENEHLNNSFITNGDFEGGKSGWQLFEGDIVSDGTAKSGSSYARLRGYTWFRMKQLVSVQANMYYSLSFYFKKNASSSCVITSTDEWLGIDGNNVLAYEQFSGKLTSVWSKVIIDFYSKKNTSVYIWFDSTGAPTPTGNNTELPESSRTCIDMVNMHTMCDVNADGKINIIDLVRLKKHISGLNTKVSILDSDLDHNKSINAVDLTILIQNLLNVY